MSWGVLPWVYPVWSSLGSLDLGDYFLPHLGKFSTIISSIFSRSFYLFSSSGTPMIQMLGHFTLSQRSLKLSPFLLILFFFFPLCFIYFYHSIFYLTYPIFCLYYSSFDSSRVFLISFIALFIIDRLFFISSLSLLYISCILSILVSRLFICNYTLFSRFWIIFTIIILNSFSGRLPISSSVVYFGGHLSSSFTYYLFILFRLLCLEYTFHILAVCGFFLL